MRQTSKLNAVLHDLMTGWVLTESLAYQRHGIVSLAQTIHRLRKRGAPIHSRLRPFNGPAGNPSRYAEYFIPASELQRIHAQSI